MTTGIIKANRIIFILFILLLQGCDMLDEPKEQPFEVFGEPSLLKDMVINIESQIDEKNHIYHKSKVQTVLYKGKTYKFTNDDVRQYTIYVSYMGNVAKVSYENIMLRLESNHINHLYVVADNKQIYLKIFSSEYYLEQNRYNTTNRTISLEEYFAKNKIVDKDEQQELTKKFYDFYNPEDQQYKTVPFTKEGIKRFEMSPMNEKLIVYVRPADLEKMNLPEDELKILIDHYNFSPDNPDKQK